MMPETHAESLKKAIDEFDELAEYTLKGLMENKALCPFEEMKISRIMRIRMSISYYLTKVKVLGIRKIFAKIK